MRLRQCRTPGCDEHFNLGRLRLCPSCRFVGRVGFAIGALVAGALLKWIG